MKFVFILFLLSTTKLSADLPVYHIIKMSINNETYYYWIEGGGQLSFKKLVYEYGTRRTSVEDIINDILQNQDSILLYKNLVQIHFPDQIRKHIMKEDSIYSYLENEVKFSTKEVMANFTINSAIRGPNDMHLPHLTKKQIKQISKGNLTVHKVKHFEYNMSILFTIGKVSEAQLGAIDYYLNNCIGEISNNELWQYCKEIFEDTELLFFNYGPCC